MGIEIYIDSLSLLRPSISPTNAAITSIASEVDSHVTSQPDKALHFMHHKEQHDLRHQRALGLFYNSLK